MLELSYNFKIDYHYFSGFLVALFKKKNHMQLSHTELLKCSKSVTPLETLQVLHNNECVMY